MARRRKSYAGRIVLLLVLLVAVILVAVFILYKDSIKKEVTKKVADTAIEQIIKAQTGVTVNIDEVKSQMEEKDAEELDDIIDKYADVDKLKECAELYKSNGKEAVKEYLKGEVDTGDIDKLKELYNKYEDTIAIE